MLNLLTFPTHFGEPGGSPFAVKAICLLNMSGQDWKNSQADVRKMPKAKLPVLKVGERLIPDSENIRAYLEQQGADFDKGLSDAQRATSRAFIRMAEEHLYFHLVADRWLRDDMWPITRDTFFGMIPKVMRGIITGKIRKSLRAGLHTQGIERFTEIERAERVAKDLEAIKLQLGDKPYLFGDAPTAADASVCPMLSSLASIPLPTEVSNLVKSDDRLTGYITRMRAALYHIP
ncbi:glutathione S-transferase family protein [Profundibacter sp.]